MTLLLYYSYSRGLSEDEIVEIDKQFFRNRELVYAFITKLPLNTNEYKTKSKKSNCCDCFRSHFTSSVFIVGQPSFQFINF